jgi:hypothetical protein
MERLKFWRTCLVTFAVVLAFALPQVLSATVVVKTVPLDPNNPTTPHVTYPLDGTHEVTIVLGATVDLGGSTDSFTYSWNFGDGSAATAPAAVTQPFDISAQHQYPPGAAGGTTWTAVVTVTDTNTSATYSANYYVIQQANNLSSRVDVAIDNGLWYLHQSMWRCNNGKLSGGPYNNVANPNCGVGGVYGPTGKYGGWDQITFGCVFSPCYANLAYEGINGSNVQAFEVNGHFESGPASDPYTDDVNNALARMFMLLTNTAVTSKTYNAAVPSCSPSPCTFTFDGNTNGQAIYVNQSQPMYQGGMIMDAIVASGTPATLTHTGPAMGGGLPGINGISYKDVVQDMVDGYSYCQNNSANGYDGIGGAWGYNCLNQNYDDGSVSQWAAIGLIGANRSAFGISIPAIVKDTNGLWTTADQCTSGVYTGIFGYNIYNYGKCNPPWGPFAITPSGMVQLTMDQVGRGNSKWDLAETYYHDNFCNPPSSGATVSPRDYTYGLFSFTKSMLLHDPGGVPTAITLLEDRPAGTNAIDWYSAIGPESGGPNSCDGVAQTLVKRQGIFGGDGGSVGSPNPSSPQNGYWQGHYFDGNQGYFETAWTIIMLRKTVFAACPQNLNGRGTPSGLAPARIDLTWTAVTNGAASYNVMRGTTSGGPYTLEGNSTLPGFSDRTGLVNGDTYYYILQPLDANGNPIACQSNEAKITVPMKKVY